MLLFAIYAWYFSDDSMVYTLFSSLFNVLVILTYIFKTPFLLSPGLTAELFYVRDGQINFYALKYVVPVPATIGELHFTWQSLARKPVSIASLSAIV